LHGKNNSMNALVKTQEFTITPSIYRSILSRSMLQRSQRGIWLVVATPIIIGVWSRGNIPMILSWWPFLFFMGCWFVVSIYGFPYYLSRSKTNPVCSYGGVIVFESEYIQHIRQDGGIVKKSWQEFPRIMIEKEALVFLEKRGVSMIVPLAAFSTPLDKEAIITKIHTRQRK